MKGPKVLLIDIETSPTLAWVYGYWNTNVLAIEQDWVILSVAWRWEGGATRALSLGQRTEEELVQKVWDLINEADVVVAHNGDRFDLPKMRTKFLANRMGPPSPVTSIDTLKEVKRYFAHPSNSLRDLARYEGLTAKMSYSDLDWRAAMDLDPKELRKMRSYNRRDVDVLAELYELIRPWIGNPGHVRTVNMARYVEDDEVCPSCGAADSLVKEGWYHRANMKYQRYHCRVCGTWAKARRAETDYRPEVM